MANILLMPVGSHGDVHPFVALGRALQARGHEATLITSSGVPLATIHLQPSMLYSKHAPPHLPA